MNTTVDTNSGALWTPTVNSKSGHPQWTTQWRLIVDATEDSTVPPIVGTTADTTADTTVDITVTQWTPAVDTHNGLHSGHHSDDLRGRPIRRHDLGGF